MNFLLLAMIIIGIGFIGTSVSPIQAQDVGNKIPNDMHYGDCIGGWGSAQNKD